MNYKKILRLEGLVALGVALAIYFQLSLNWLWLLLILVPDISMLGYVKNPKLGALVYNLGHTYIFPLGLFGGNMYFQNRAVFLISLLWIAHIAMDRALGYGLKLQASFTDTHLGNIGKV